MKMKTAGWWKHVGRFGVAALSVLALSGSAWSWSLEEASKPYKGSTLRVGIAMVPVIEGYLPLIKNFSKRTGIKVKVEKYTHGEWDAKGDADLYSRTGHFDLLQMHHNRAEDWAVNGHVRWINKYMKDAKLRDPNLDPDDFLQPLWDDNCLFEGGKRACFPTYNFQMVYWYRQDWFGHPAEKAAFKSKYGYDLGPAKTFKEFRDIAEFFTRKKGQKIAGKVLKSNHYGVGLVGKREMSLSWEWYLILNGWGIKLYEKNGRPNFDQQAVIDATKWWLGLRPFAPPGVSEAGFIDLFVLMLKGNIAQSLNWIDFAFAIDIPKISKAVGAYTYDTVPVRKIGIPPSGWGEGEPMVISKYSKNAEAAYLFVQWMSSKETQKKWIEGTGSGLPVRKSSLELPFVKKHPVFAPTIVSMKNGWFDAGYSSYAQVREEILIQITQAAAGQKTVEQAMKQVQAKALKLHPKGPINPGQPSVNQFHR
ncbi:MAG: extracellular solute-binding protein [Nitrospinota bacterium]|jgi:ABC-type glycerol-3-phosphate transport system substrate-binding protein|nr:extracellular solute-binding protein [Nitrospinota bacterium]